MPRHELNDEDITYISKTIISLLPFFMIATTAVVLHRQSDKIIKSLEKINNANPGHRIH
jgi:hypothetical protein